MSLEYVNTALQAVAAIVDKARDITAYTEDKSLSDLTKLTRVEPLTIISEDLQNLEYLPDINQSLVNLFAAYYLQAVAILTKVNDVEVVKTLDALNPDRDVSGFLLTERLSKESIDNLVLESYKHTLPLGNKPALENDKGGSINLAEAVNLSVGKLINVSIAYKDTKGETSKVTIPVNVRLMVSLMRSNLVVHLLTRQKVERDLTERFHLWRAKRISFWKDLVWCQDMIDEDKKNLMTDQTGTLQEMTRRVVNSKKFGLLTHNPSLASASNIIVMSKTEADEIGRILGGKVANPSIRDKMFESTYAMIIVVVDKEMERVTFYTRNIAASTDLSIKEIKSANKNRGPDISDLLKSLQMGSSPSF